MLIKILIGLAAVLAILAIVVAVQPADFRVSRTATISAPPATVYAQINDLHAWQEWSPWAKLDPNSKISYEGPATGTGSAFSWSGNNEVGEGKMTITETRPDEFVQFRLDFVRPFAGTNTAEFALKPEGNQTSVTWSMYGKNNFIGKAVGLVMNCDKMLGGFFEKGLAQLDAVVKTAPKASS